MDEQRRDGPRRAAQRGVALRALVAALVLSLAGQPCAAQCQYEFIPAPTLPDGFGGTIGFIPWRIGEDGVVGGRINTIPTSRPGYWDGGERLTLLPEPPGTSDAVVRGVLNIDAMVGGRSTSQPTLWRNGQLEILPFPARIDRAVATALNARLQIVGESAGIDQFGDERSRIPVLWDEGQYVELPPAPGARHTRPTAINDHGTIVGHAFVPSIPDWEVVMWKNGQIIVLGRLPGGQNIGPSDVNNRGVIVGVDVDPANVTERAFIWKDGEFMSPPLPANASGSSASQINDVGQIVGSVFLSDLGLRGSLWQGGQYYDVTDLTTDGTVILTVRAVNNHGVMVAISYRFGGGILVPIDSPAADINTDCTVDINDLLLLLGEWGRAESFADIDADGDVDAFDLVEVLVNWGPP